VSAPSPSSEQGYGVLVRRDDGTEVDVTEGVKALYDHTVQSMDWGSGMLELDDAREIINVALACGFLVPDTAQEAFEEYARQMSHLKCLICGRDVFWSYDTQHKGWHHGDLPPYGRFVAEAADHPVVLWRAP
jgi:hypothetical protein